jgi:hypothetical protein
MLQLGAVVEYFTEPDVGDLYHPRKHAVALTCSLRVNVRAGPEAQGEALKFVWFKTDKLSEVNFRLLPERGHDPRPPETQPDLNTSPALRLLSR